MAIDGPPVEQYWPPLEIEKFQIKNSYFSIHMASKQQWHPKSDV